jgi:hypothetical protein
VVFIIAHFQAVLNLANLRLSYFPQKKARKIAFGIFASEQYGTERLQSDIYSGFMLDTFTDLNRKIQQKCQMISVEQDGDRMLVLAGELELRGIHRNDVAVQNQG